MEQMNKYKARLKDISSLEFAENKAKTRLSLIRRSMVRCTAGNHGRTGAFLGLYVCSYDGGRLFSESLSHGSSGKKITKSQGSNGCLMFDLLALFSCMYRIYMQLNV